MADPLFRSKLIALQASENSALFNANKLRDIPVLPIIPADLQVLTYSKTSGGWLPTASSSTAGNLTGPITSVGLATSVASQTGTGSKFVMDTSPTLVTPNLGTPTALVGTNITGTAAGFTAGSVTTNANLTGDVTSSGNATTIGTAKVTNAMLASNASPSIGIGYATGAGATVTQATSRTTGVTLNAICGSVVTSTASLAAGVTASFTVTNSSVAISDVVLCSIRSGQTNKATRAIVSTTAAGSFEITVTNRGDGTWAGAAEVGAIVINFVIIKAVTA
jgi:hypothetical protein